MGFLWKLSGVSLLEPPELLRNRLSMGTDFIQPFFLWLTPQLISLSPFFSGVIVGIGILRASQTAG